MKFASAPFAAIPLGATRLPSVSDVVEAALSFSTSLSNTHSSGAVFDTGLSLMTSAGAMTGPTASMQSSIALAVASAITASTANIFAEVLSLGLSTATATDTTANYLTNAVLAAQAQGAFSTVVDTQAALAFESILAAAFSGILTSQVDVLLPSGIGFSLTAEVIQLNDVSVAFNISAATNTNVNAILNTALTFGIQQLMTAQGAAVYQTAVVIASQLAALAGWDSSIEAMLNLTTAVALSDSVLRVVEGDIPLGTIVQALSAAIAQYSVTTELGVTAEQGIGGGLDIDAALSFSWSLLHTADGAIFEVSTTAPSGRMITIRASDRMVTIQASDRIVSVTPSLHIIR